MVKRDFSLNVVLKIILLFFLFIFFFYKFYIFSQNNYLQDDEQNYVYRARFFDLFTEKRFTEISSYIHEMRDQPPLSYYIFGLNLKLFGFKNISIEQDKIRFNDLNYRGELLSLSDYSYGDLWWVYYSGKKSWELPIFLRSSGEMIVMARMASVVFCVGCLVLVFLLSKLIGNYIYAIIAVVLLGFNRLMLVTGTHAMSDSILIFFMLFSVLITVFGARYFYRRKIAKYLFFSFLMGIVSGLATSAKLNGGMVLFVWVLVIYILHVKRYRRGGNNIRFSLFLWLAGILISFIVAFSVFIFLNPYLYSDPIVNSIEMISYRIGIGKMQQNDHTQALISLSDKFNAVFDRNLIGVYNNFGNKRLDMFLFIFGILSLFKNGKFFGSWVFKGNVDRSISILVILVWIIVTFVSLIIYIPMDWDHYYLVVTPCIVVCQAYGISMVIDWIWRKLNKG